MSLPGRRAIVTFAISILVLSCGAGCASNQYSKIAEYRADTPLPEFKEAPNDATYGLYASWDPSPLVTYPLNQGDRLGFDKDENGNAVAVAGNNRYPLRTSMMVGNYYWAMKR